MLGPNVTPEIHHREEAFEILYKDLCDTFKEKFNISNNYIVLPITGSGTLALEILINSLDIKFEHKFTDEEFGSRLEKINHQEKGTEGVAWVQYETSISKLNTLEVPNNKVVLVDAVSSFPYYNIPKEADAWVTVNSKQLGCSPGLSFIIIGKHILDKVKPEEFSYLSLQRYLNFNKINQTPNTPAIGIMKETLTKLKEFNLEKFRKNIDVRRDKIYRIFEKNIGGGPVFTTDLSDSIDIKKEFGLYGKKNTQIFLWSGKEEEYDKLLEYKERKK